MWRLWNVYFLFVLSIAIRIYSESTHYISPDSEFYLEAAQNLINGNGLRVSKSYPVEKVFDVNNTIQLTMWPIGYPLLIALVSIVSGLNVFLSSKIIGIIFLAIIFYLLYFKYKNEAWKYGMVFGSFTLIEVFSYTWSEAPFLSVWLIFYFYINDLINNKLDFGLIAKGITICVSLFILRYIGAISLLFLTSIFIFKSFINKKFSVGLFFMIGSVLLFYVSYSIYNYIFSGYFTGSYRFQYEQESIYQWGVICFNGIMNEFFVFRKFWNVGIAAEWLFFLCLGVQIAFLIYLNQLLNKPFQINQNIKVALFMAVSYTITICILRKLSPFDPINYRLMAPATLLGLLAAVEFININTKKEYRIDLWILSFFGFSLMMNLPKNYLIEKISAVIF
ncbi:MAG: hypothetical protein SFY32_03075 [Bacteroidota bacterium]|nr:hypothetical protein [Bacteroidota bacterium]